MPKKLTNITKKPSFELDSESLVVLAEKHTLPKFQYMDEMTYRWILQNNPGYEVAKLPNVQSDLSWLSTLNLPSEWFLEPRLVDSLHGLRHLLRTAYFSLCLIGDVPRQDINTKCAIIAALVHDIRRLDDKGDSGHAERSARWFRQHAVEVGSRFGSTLTVEDIVSIETAIALHEVPYKDFTLQQQSLYHEHAILVDLLKTADALDRYRLPKLKWWINDEYLRLVPSPAMKQIAFNLIALSEGNFLKLKDSQESVISATRHLQLRHDPTNAHWHNTHVFYGTYGRGL